MHNYGDDSGGGGGGGGGVLCGSNTCTCTYCCIVGLHVYSTRSDDIMLPVFT